MLRLLPLALVIALLTALAPASAQETQTGTLLVDGVERSYTLTLPASLRDGEQHPLLIALHPFASSGRALQALSGLDAAASPADFLVAYPDSFDLGWNDGALAAGWPIQLPDSDDVGFVAALIDDLAARYPVDTARVHLTGFADGGEMAYRLLCSIPERFAGAAIVNALTWDYQAENCGISAPVPLLVLHSADNHEVPPSGSARTAGEPPVTIRQLSAEETAAFWAARNECDLASVQHTDAPDASVRYVDCAAPVAVYLLDGIDNTWPRAGDYAINQTGLDAASIVIDSFLSNPLISLTRDLSVARDEPARSYWVYVPPSYDPAEPMPLVVALHGRMQTGPGLAYLFDLNRVAREQGFIVVYPDGTPIPGVQGREWNYMRGARGYADNEVDDTTFLRLLLDDLARDLNIDPARRYLTGFSNGGFMTQRVACEDPEPWAGFASVSATMYPDLMGLCEGKPPVPMLLMHGTRDANVAWGGVSFRGVVQYLPAPDTSIFWAQHDDCQPKDTDLTILPKADPDAPTEVYIYSFGGCADGSEVVFYVIDGGGHNLPGLTGRLSREIAGETNTDIRAGEVIWQFFARHARSDAAESGM